MNFQNIIQQAFQGSADNYQKLASNKELMNTVEKVAQAIIESYKKDGALYIAGNGGSAADAQHMAAELVIKLSKDRTSIRAYAMTTDTSLLTACGNDFGYDYCFHRQVQGLMRKNDVFLGITTSGNSPNILHALNACKELGATSILLSGRDGGKARELADYAILAPGDNTAHIQECHLVIYHTLCFLIEQGLIEAGVCKYQKSY